MGRRFYGSGLDYFSDCCGRLFTLDATNAQVTWVGDTLGFGTNPYDTAHALPIANGGLAVHPVTGDLWGIEALKSFAPVMYRIDRTTGVADSIVRLGLGGVGAPQTIGFDGLHILPDGTFIATRGGPSSPPDSTLWVISSVLDPGTGLAEIAPIALTFPTPPLAGHLNGLAGLPSQAPAVLTLSADETQLYPWVRFYSPVQPAPFEQPGRLGDDATLTVVASVGGQPLAGQEVTIRGEFLPGTGGHAHVTGRVDIADAHLVDLPGTELAGDGKPVLGVFVQGADTTTTVTGNTNSEGELVLDFVAGFVSGDLEVTATTSYAGETVEATLVLHVGVPGLVPMDQNSDIMANALMIGPTSYHLSGDIWYATEEFQQSVGDLVRGLKQTIGAQGYFLQLNDASLPQGGAFTVTPPQIATGIRLEDYRSNPPIGHGMHALGIDEDISWCYAKMTGFDPPGRIRGTDCEGQGTIEVNPEAFGDYGFKVLVEDGLGSDPHYHVRLEDS